MLRRSFVFLTRRELPAAVTVSTAGVGNGHKISGVEPDKQQTKSMSRKRSGGPSSSQRSPRKDGKSGKSGSSDRSAHPSSSGNQR